MLMRKWVYRAGEKLHEVMILKKSLENCIEINNKYIITPQLSWWNKTAFENKVRKNSKKFQMNLNILVIKIKNGYQSSS